MNLYLFNPENDLAIAFGGENYTPPPAAQLIGKELSALPLWYADDDSTIYIPDKLPSDFLHTLAPFHLKISTVTPDRLDGAQAKQIHVWGWNRDLIKRLRLAGIVKPYYRPHDNAIPFGNYPTENFPPKSGNTFVTASITLFPNFR